jgi:hypothetical protein
MLYQSDALAHATALRDELCPVLARLPVSFRGLFIRSSAAGHYSASAASGRCFAAGCDY